MCLWMSSQSFIICDHWQFGKSSMRIHMQNRTVCRLNYSFMRAEMSFDTILLLPHEFNEQLRKRMFVPILRRKIITILCSKVSRWILRQFDNQKVLSLQNSMRNMFCLPLMFDLPARILFIRILMCNRMPHIPDSLLFTWKFNQMFQKVPNSILRFGVDKEMPARLSSFILSKRQHENLHIVSNRMPYLRLSGLFELFKGVHLLEHDKIMQSVL